MISFLNGIKKRVKTPKGAQLGIAALSSLVDISTANNTVAIVMAGPIAKDISNEFSISPKRTAAILDIFTSVWQGIIPYGAQILYACAGAAAVGMTLSPVELFPYLFYPILMGISAVVFILFFGNRKKVKIRVRAANKNGDDTVISIFLFVFYLFDVFRHK